MNALTGITSILPSDYRLYLESMMPSMSGVPIDKSYFDEDMYGQIIDSVLSKYAQNPTQNLSGSIGEMDYITSRNPLGHNDPERVTGFNQLFNTLGSYNYEITPPGLEQQAIGHYKAATDPNITITDRYDWNPDYGIRTTGPITYGWTGDQPASRRGDVTTAMLAKHLWNQRKGLDKANTLEMLGNYLGHRQSEEEGRDVDINIPIKVSDLKKYTKPDVVARKDTTDRKESKRKQRTRSREAQRIRSRGAQQMPKPSKSRGYSNVRKYGRADGGLVSINHITRRL